MKDVPEYRRRTMEESIAMYGLVPGSAEEELFTVLDLIVAEFETDPVSVQCFDLRTVDRAKEIVGKYRRHLQRRQGEGRSRGDCYMEQESVMTRQTDTSSRYRYF